jgi:hypothetical protein
MRTLTIKKGGGGGWSDGWNHATITKAEYGTYNGTRFIDVWFEGYPDSLNLRVYETKNQEGEEFAIGQLFRFANAGIVEGLEGPDGNIVVKLSDEPDNLRGKSLNIFLHKDGEYSRVLKQVAPTVFSNAVDSFKDNDVSFWKSKAERFYKERVAPKLTTANAEADGIPY